MTTSSRVHLPRPVIAMVTDRRRYDEADDAARIERLIEDAERAARARVDLIQVRERGLDDRTLLDLVERLVRAVVRPTRVIVNRRADIAAAAGANGLHLPADAPPASRVRELLAREAVVGRSVHSIEEALAAEQDGGCDYLTFGTVYPSASKPAGHVPAGLERLRAVCQAVQLPVLAIGGIQPERAGEVAGCGAAGIAAIGMFVTTAAPRDAEADERLIAHVARVRAAFDPLQPARLE